MESFSSHLFITTVGLVGLVILVAALLSGLIERSGVPQIAVLLGLGAALGPAGLGVLDIGLDSPILRIVATLGLALVLFTDAVRLDLGEVRRHSLLALLMVGPGTLVMAALLGLASWALLGLPPAAAMVLGAALASTDPILLRGMLRDSGLGAGARLALRLESGMNDVALLPIVIVAMVFMSGASAMTPLEWTRIGINLFILGPGAGVIVGLFSVAVLDLIRRRIGIRRDYESLYALGVAFSAFAAAELVQGSGFLAAFAAGLTVSALDVELCDCFIEYGETTAEMILLFTFVLFGSGLIWSGLTAISLGTLLFALVIFLARLPVLYVALARTGLDRRTRLLIGWFGPRGLGSLLLVLLPVFAGTPGSEGLFAICALMVLLSVALHGGTPLVLRKRAAPASPAPAVPPIATLSTQPEAVAPATKDGKSCPLTETGDGASCPQQHDERTSVPTDQIRIGIEELLALQRAGEAVTLLDVRTPRSRSRSAMQIAGSVRMRPDRIAERAVGLGLRRNAWIIPYCT